jgi:hypothetical protein
MTMKTSHRNLTDLWFPSTGTPKRAAASRSLQDVLDAHCVSILVSAMNANTPISRPKKDGSYGPAGARCEATIDGKDYELVVYFHSSGGKLSGSCTVVFSSSQSDSFDWKGSDTPKAIAQRAIKMVEKTSKKAK